MNYMTEVVPGFTNYFTIKPTQTVSSNDLKGHLSPLQRSCRFNDEIPNNMTLFKNYSKAACQFECMISIM